MTGQLGYRGRTLFLFLALAARVKSEPVGKDAIIAHVSARQPVALVDGRVGRLLIDKETVRFELDLSRVVRSRIETDLESYSSVPKISEMRRRFSGKFVSVAYMPRIDVTRLVVIQRESLPNLEDPWLLEFVLYSQTGRANPRFSALISYDWRWKAILFAGIRYSGSVWLDALLIHELYHALAPTWQPKRPCADPFRFLDLKKNLKLIGLRKPPFLC